MTEDDVGIGEFLEVGLKGANSILSKKRTKRSWTLRSLILSLAP